MLGMVPGMSIGAKLTLEFPFQQQPDRWSTLVVYGFSTYMLLPSCFQSRTMTLCAISGTANRIKEALCSMHCNTFGRLAGATTADALVVVVVCDETNWQIHAGATCDL